MLVQFIILYNFQYNQLISLLERIAEHPYAYKYHDEIFKFRTELAAQTSRLEIPEVCLKGTLMCNVSAHKTINV